MSMTVRSLGTMILLFLVTFGLYQIYWTVVTKRELNTLGARIPTAWLLIIPVVNIYFLYTFAQGYAKVVVNDERPTATLVYFLLLMCLYPLVSMLVMQFQMNQYAENANT
jgi:hypothetical protein